MKFFNSKINTKGFTQHYFPRWRKKVGSPSTIFLHQKNGAGFTLVELLVVLSAMALLSTIIVDIHEDLEGKARDAVRLEDLKTIQLSLQLYKIENGHYPIFNYPAAYSTSSRWDDLKNELGVSNLPVDPINEGNLIFSGYSYYYSSNISGSEYDLMMNLENKSDLTCNNTIWSSNHSKFTSGWLAGIYINWCSMSSLLKSTYLNNYSGSAYLIMDH